MAVDFNDPNWQKKQWEAHLADKAAREALLAKPANATYGTHAAEGLNDRPWQIETTYKHPGNRRQYMDSLKASGVGGTEFTKAMRDYQFKKDLYQAQEQRNEKSMSLANRGGTWSPRHQEETKKDYSGSGVPTAHTGGSTAMPSQSDLTKFYEFLGTDAGKAWTLQQQGKESPYAPTANAAMPNPNQPSWVPEGYTLYGDDKTGVTLPTGANFQDAMFKGGWMESIPGANPYYPNGANTGKLSLGGSPTETKVPPVPKQPASGPVQNPGSGATSNADLKAFLEYLAGRAGSANPIVGAPHQQATYTSRPSGPSYGAVVQKGLL